MHIVDIKVFTRHGSRVPLIVYVIKSYTIEACALITICFSHISIEIFFTFFNIGIRLEISICIGKRIFRFFCWLEFNFVCWFFGSKLNKFLGLARIQCVVTCVSVNGVYVFSFVKWINDGCLN